MLGNPCFHPLFLAAALPLSPLLLMVLCVVAGVGTVLLLPSRRQTPLVKIGAVILLAAGLIFVALVVRISSGRADGSVGVYFWIFSAIAIVGAVRVVTHPKPVYSALYFVLTVFASAGLFVLLWADFMAAALVLIYAGAILVTYVFVIMLAAEAAPPGAAGALMDHDAVSREPVLASAVGFMLMGVLLFVIFDKAESLPRAMPAAAPASFVSGATQELGEFLFRNHLVSLELAGLILTVSMIGAIVIARRQVYREAPGAEFIDERPEVVLGLATPVDDNPHSIPVVGTFNPRQKSYPGT